MALERLWQISPSEIVQLEVLGQGTFGDTLLCEWGQRATAVKCLRKTPMIDDFVDRSFENISGELRALHHAHVALYFGSGMYPDGKIFSFTCLSSVKDGGIGGKFNSFWKN